MTFAEEISLSGKPVSRHGILCRRQIQGVHQRGNDIKVSLAEVERRHACRGNSFADQITEPGNSPLPQVAFSDHGWTILSTARVHAVANGTSGRDYLVTAGQRQHVRAGISGP